METGEQYYIILPQCGLSVLALLLSDFLELVISWSCTGGRDV